jgi:hypothetical protein
VIGVEDSPVTIEPDRQVQDRQAFLRMAAIELRRIAERAPDVAVELGHVAEKLEAEAEDLAGDTALGSEAEPTVPAEAKPISDAVPPRSNDDPPQGT